MKSKMNNKEKGVNNEMKSQPSDHSVTEKTDPGKEERELKPLDDPAPDAPDMEEIVTFARRYYATGFPNPQRRGCPPPGEIMKVVSRRRAPDQALREHLFECSECFGEYRQALAQLRNEVVGWKRLISGFTLMRVSTSAVILLLLVLAGRLIWSKLMPDGRSEQIGRSNPSGAQIRDAVEPKPNKTTGQAPDAPSSAEIAKLPVNRRVIGGASRSLKIHEPGAKTFDVDLDDYPVFRRSQEEKPPVVLPAIRARLVLRLPDTAAAGKYTVSLIDAFGKVLASEPAVSPDGDTLRVNLDLRRFPPKKYRLSLSRTGEAPAFYDVIIKR